MSELPFLAKDLEKIVTEPIISFMSGNGLFGGFRAQKVHSSGFYMILSQQLTVVNTLHHSWLRLLTPSIISILTKRPKIGLDISGLVLNWFHSYLSGTSLGVEFGNN